MVDQKDYIREQIAKVVKNKIKAQSISIPEVISIPVAERSKFLTNFLVICVFCMIFIMSFLVVGQTFNKKGNTIVIRQQPTIPSVQYMTQSDADRINGRITGIESSLKEWQDKTWLLGVADSENTNMITNLTRKYFPQEQSDYLVLDGEWKLNRMPRNLKMEDKHKEKLQQYVK